MGFPVNMTFWSGSRGKKIGRELMQSLVVTLVTWFAGPTPGAAQIAAAPHNPPIVCVSNASRGIREVNSVNNSVIVAGRFPNSANGVAITPDGLIAAPRDDAEDDSE
jgi:hypothetical protein